MSTAETPWPSDICVACSLSFARHTRGMHRFIATPAAMDFKEATGRWPTVADMSGPAS